MTGSSPRPFGALDHARVLRNVRDRRVNFAESEPRRPGWHFDTDRRHLADESPGPPEPGGAWEIACALVRDYEFSVPNRVCAVYDRRDPLAGRDMLLEGRFYGLRFIMGVRVTAVIDQTRDDDQRVWGWSYETLDGHLERGRMTYEVVKDMDSGRVDFVITGFSQAAPTLGPIVRLGWSLFGRATQLRFYRRCGARLHALVQAQLDRQQIPSPARVHDNVVLVPSDARVGGFERIAARFTHPGSPRHR